MTSASSARTFEVRHLQLVRAAIAAIAAVMVTFSPDHSAAVGLVVFSGFAFATGLALAFGAWLVHPRGRRGATVALAVLTMLAAMAASIGPLRSTALFFAVVISWALTTGLVETVAAWRSRGADAASSLRRDGMTVGILTLVLGIVLLFTPAQYALDYYIDDAGRWFTLTGTTIAVGVFGGYAAIVAVYLGIAGFSPRRDATPPEQTPAERASEEGVS